MTTVSTTEINDVPPQWTKVILFSGPAEGGDLAIGFSCKNMPTDSYVSMQVPGPDPDNSIYVDKTLITSLNMSCLIFIRWPPGFSSYAIINWWKGKVDQPDGATVSPAVAYLKKEIPSEFEGVSAVPVPKPQLMPGYNSRDMLNDEIVEYEIIGSVKINIFDNVSPYMTWNTPITQPEGRGEFCIGYECNNMPTDSFLSVTIPGPDDENSFIRPKTRIKSPNFFELMSLIWPPGFSTIGEISWWKGNINPPIGANIQIVMLSQRK